MAEHITRAYNSVRFILTPLATHEIPDPREVEWIVIRSKPQNAKIIKAQHCNTGTTVVRKVVA